MNDPINQFKDSAHDVRLSKEAYARMRERLVAHMSISPAIVHSPYARFFGALSPFAANLRKPVAALVLVTVIAVGGATTYAAEGSLPGDPLYPLKVKVIEPAQGLLAVTPEAKAAWHASVAATRLSEAAQLAAREKLTPEESAKSEERFSHSLQAARDSIDTLSQDNPQAAAKITAELTASLDEHQTALGALSSTSPNAEEAHALAGHVRKEIDSILSEDGSASSTDATPGSNGTEKKNDAPVPVQGQLNGKHSIRGAPDEGGEGIFGGLDD